DGVAVEDELVLAADEVDVGEGAAGLTGAAGAQVQADVVLVALVRGGVQGEQQPGPGGAGDADGPAVLPEVLADDGGDVDAVDADDGEPVAAHEDAVLVEHAVVGEVVLGRPHQHLAAVPPRRPVERCPGRLPGPPQP